MARRLRPTSTPLMLDLSYSTIWVRTCDLPADDLRRIRSFRKVRAFRINVALSELPRFTALPEPGEHLQSVVIMAPKPHYMTALSMRRRTAGRGSRSSSC